MSKITTTIATTNNLPYLKLAVQSVRKNAYYKDMPFIESIDTLNPIMAALEGTEYQDYGLLSKPVVNMNLVFEWENFDQVEYAVDKIDLVENNVKKFKAINNLL